MKKVYTEDSSDGPLCTVIRAIGMAGISNITNSTSVQLRAKHQYLKALNQVQIIMSDATIAAEDTTFVAVLLLALYEVIFLFFLEESFRQC